MGDHTISIVPVLTLYCWVGVLWFLFLTQFQMSVCMYLTFSYEWKNPHGISHGEISMFVNQTELEVQRKADLLSSSL